MSVVSTVYDENATDSLRTGQSLTGGYQTATTAAGLIAFLTPAIVPAAPVLPEVVLTAIAYAAAIVPTGAGNSATTDGSIWTITPSSNPGDPQSLSAVYQNSDGGIVSPITFFQVVGSNVRFTSSIVSTATDRLLSSSSD